MNKQSDQQITGSGVELRACEQCPGLFPTEESLAEHLALHSIPQLPALPAKAVGNKADMYEELAGDQIRLLEISASLDFDSPLEGEMRTVNLGAAPDYIALSYHWGTEDEAMPSEPILINGHQIELSTPLAQALRQMRAHNNLVLWTDRICIKQESRELSQQVLRMFTIYETAKEVAIWLGPHQHRSEQFIQSLATNDPWSIEVEPAKALLRRSYWTRVWIVQEVAAAASLRLYCGDSVLDWDRFEEWLRTVSTSAEVERGARQPANSASIAGLTGKDFRAAWKVVKLRARYRDSSPRPLTMLQVLYETQASETTDARDKVYGILGLASDVRKWIAEPNYADNFTVADLCLQMAERSFMRTGGLDIIRLGSTKNLSLPVKLPTWCPNFLSLGNDAHTSALVESLDTGTRSIPWRGASPGQFMIRTTRYLGETRRAENLQAMALLREMHPHSIGVKRTLNASGWLLGTVDGLGCIGDETHARYSASSQTWKTPNLLTRMFVRLVAKFDPRSKVKLPGRCQDYRKALHMYCQQLNADPLHGVQSDECVLDVLCARLFLRILRACGAPDAMAWVSANRDFKLRGVPLHHWKSEYRAMWSFGIDNMTLHWLSRLRIERWRLMTADEYVGFAHPDAELGDQVWLINGCTEAIILRPQPDGDPASHLVVGDCYLPQNRHYGAWRMVSEQPENMVQVRIG